MLRYKFRNASAERFGDKALGASISAVVAASLLLVYTLPNVIALRNSLTVIGVLLTWRAAAETFREGSARTRLCVAMLILLTAWMLTVAILIAPDIWASVDELKAEWLPPMLAFIFGMGLYRRLGAIRSVSTERVFWLVLFVPLTALMLAQSTAVIFEFSRTRYISPHFSGISDHKANITYAAGLLLPMLFALSVSHAYGIFRLAHRMAWMVMSAFLLTMGVVLTSGARNGFLVSGTGFAIATIAVVSGLLRSRRSFKIPIALGLVVIVLILSFFWAGFRWDPRWSHFVDAVPIAFDTENHREWLEPPGSPMPRTADGTPVEESAYQRIAWAKVGVAKLLNHPFGVEIGRNTFRRLVREEYGRGEMAHAHNSFIDFGLNVGFPGLLLWIGFLGALAVTGLSASSSIGRVAGIALIFLVLMFVLRMFLDSIMRDHILEQFMFVAGALLGAVISSPLDIPRPSQ